MLTNEQKTQFSEIFEEIGKSLDITKAQHEAAVKSYEYVGTWLHSGLTLKPFNPEILPQGSFMLGTMIKPVHKDDDLDIDLVCRLEGKRPEWTQYNLKKAVGDRLSENDILKRLLKIPEGRRCWTLQYSDSAKFHLDILPSLVSKDYRIIMEKASIASEPNFETLAIRITDNLELNYSTEVTPERWPKSNPFGYGIWFENKAKLLSSEIRILSEALQPVPKYQINKLPLQRVVQILKRHRDIMFNGDKDKPISIIITTLAAKAYNKEPDIIEALINVIERMQNFIEERYSAKHGKYIKWIGNPVNEIENFADKWPEHPEREVNFYLWLSQTKTDIYTIFSKRGVGLIMESLERPFGKDIASDAVNNYAENLLKHRESGTLKMEAGTGMLGSTGIRVKDHNFHGI
jgi:hypothetical protein